MNVPSGLRLGAGLLAAFFAGCSDPPPERARGSVGLFYGGQVQELQVIELGRDRAPAFGFRVLLADAAAHRVKWEITRPGPAGRRVVEQGVSELDGRRTSFDQVIPLGLDSPSGTWNVRVTVDDRLVIDRALLFRNGPP